MSDIKWGSLIIQCNDAQSIRPASELAHKQRVGNVIVPPESIEQSIMGRSMMKAKYHLLTTIKNPSQRAPGSDKFININADVFDVEGFEIVPMKTDNPQVLLKDLRMCSDFLKNNLNQQVTIGWNLSGHGLKDKETLQLLDSIAKGYRPDYIRFDESQGLICTIAKKICATKMALPFNADVESDWKIIEASEALKLRKPSSLRNNQHKNDLGLK
jgi:hypothetical protein